MTFGPKPRSDEAWSHLSNRRPSATLAIVLMTQIQFLATLSFVGYIDEGDSFLDDLLQGLRWGILAVPFLGPPTKGQTKREHPHVAGMP